MSENNAYSNASAWMETLKGYVLAMDQETWDRVEELEDTESLSEDEALEFIELKGILGEHEDAESAMDNARDSALDVMVRSSWHSVGDNPDAEESALLAYASLFCFDC